MERLTERFTPEALERIDVLIVMELRRIPATRRLRAGDAERLLMREMAASSESARRLVATRFGADRLPETLPAFEGLVVSQAGELSIEAYRPDPRQPRRWEVL